MLVDFFITRENEKGDDREKERGVNTGANETNPTAMVRRRSTPTRNESGMLRRERATESADWLTRARQGRGEQEERREQREAGATSGVLGRSVGRAITDTRDARADSSPRSRAERANRETVRPRAGDSRARTATPKTTRITVRGARAPTVCAVSTYARPSA